MKCELGKTYVCRNGLIKTLDSVDDHGCLFDHRNDYIYGTDENGSSVYADLDFYHPHDIVCELMKG